MLNFEPITLEKKAVMEPFLYAYGEGSCQHSFVSMFCMTQKYGDQMCIKNGYLFILRSKKCSPAQRVYLFPMGDTENPAGLAGAVEEIFHDAHDHGAAVRFETVTQRAKELLLELFPERLQAEYIRDYAEYLYTYTRLADLPGSEMASKRHDINTFLRNYGDRVRIERIQPEHMGVIRDFQKYWLEDYLAGDEDVQLECENAAIGLGLNHFSALGLSGIVVFVDDKVAGYAYGAPLSADCYDVMIEKGDRRVADIYRILNRDMVRMCCRDFSFINREEDVGVEGLRKAKLSYKPDCFIEKYVVTEVMDLESA